MYGNNLIYQYIIFIFLKFNWVNQIIFAGKDEIETQFRFHPLRSIVITVRSGATLQSFRSISNYEIATLRNDNEL